MAVQERNGTPSQETLLEAGKFGTFKGVFTPSLLTILGVIMYLRLGWVLGNVGLVQTLIIVTLSSFITFLTGLSISATATNMKVGGGGAYYMISRSLGVEAGAAIGLPLFLSQALVVSFYITGFAESLVKLFPSLPPVGVGIVTLLVLTVLAYLSADLALKAQFFILTIICLSLVSLFMGEPPAQWPSVSEVPDPQSFWVVFAVFFPAVTGIEAGIAMSGNLRDPSRALPLGTLGAVLTGYAVYMAIPLFLDGLVPREVLLTDSLVMQKIARWGELIILGVWGATLSSALSSLLGAPRTLQALARDGVVPRFLGKGVGPGDEPRLATAVTFAIAFLGLLAGELNVIAPVLSMFFLTSYGILNLSAGFEGLIGSPSWRPKFRTPWTLSLLGAFGCLATMFMINPGATFIAIFLCSAVFYLMQRRQLRAHWGDMRYGILMLLARYAVYRLAESQPDERSWRPNILVLSGSPTARWYLIELADAITHGKGFLTVAAIIPEDSAEMERLDSIRTSIKEYLRKRGVPALVEVNLADEVMTGAQSLVRTYGIGPLVPNTVLLGETERSENFLQYARLIELVYHTRRNLVMVREGHSPPVFGRGRRIDIWWGRERQNAGLMLALGYLLHTSPEWEDAELSLKTIVSSPEERMGAQLRLQELLASGRVDANVEVLVCGDGDVFETIREGSRGAHLVFLGIRPPEREETSEEYSRYYQTLLEKTSKFPPTALVLAAENIEFSRIFEA